MSFDIEHYSDGRKSKYGNEYGLDLDATVEHLIYYDCISEKYDNDELTKYLTNMKTGFQHYRMMGTRWFEFKITKNQ